MERGCLVLHLPSVCIHIIFGTEKQLARNDLTLGSTAVWQFMSEKEKTNKPECDVGLKAGGKMGS